MNVPELAPGAIFKDDGMPSPELDLVRATEYPPEDAAAEIFTVPVPDAPPTRYVGVTVTPLID